MKKDLDFAECFKCLTGYEPMHWQSRLYKDKFSKGNIPSAIAIPTGLGKTSVIHIWLIALANTYRLRPDVCSPGFCDHDMDSFRRANSWQNSL